MVTNKVPAAININTKNLVIQQLTEHKVRLENLQANKKQKGWFKVMVDVRHLAAHERLHEPRLSLFLQQNDNIQSVDLIRESAHHFSLIIYRDSALKCITLRWHVEPPQSNSNELAITIHPMSSARAWAEMLRKVSQDYKRHGFSRLEIYRKTKARLKRWGWRHALRKLVEEYQPLLIQQLVSSEPYDHWRFIHEQASDDAALHQLNASAKAHVWQSLLIIVRINHSNIIHFENSLNSLLRISGNPCSILIDDSCDLIAADSFDQRQTDHHITVLKSDDDVEAFLLRDQWRDNHYLMIIDAGDQVSSMIASQLNNRIHADSDKPDVIYWDHDRINHSGERIKPSFKSRWNPDLFMSQNYLGNAFALHGIYASRLTHADHLWWRRSYYEILLQAFIHTFGNDELLDYASLSQTAVIHIPVIMTHQHLENKKFGYSEPDQQRILQRLSEFASLRGHDVDSITETSFAGIFQTNYCLENPPPLVSIIIPTRDSLEFLQPCVTSVLEKTDYPHYEILIIDNQSSDAETLAWFKHIKQDPRVHVLPYDHEFNYSAINNFGVAKAKGSILCLLNNDTEVISPNWLTEMVRHASRKGVGAVGAKLYYQDYSIQHAGVILGLWGLAGHSHKNFHRYDLGYQARLVCTQNVSATTAACLVVKKSLYLEVAGLDEQNLTVSFNDVDFCLKLLRCGYLNVWTPHAELFHLESKSRGKEDTPEKKQREAQEISYMQEKWSDFINDDPYYSPHLSKHSEDYSIAIPLDR